MSANMPVPWILCVGTHRVSWWNKFGDVPSVKLTVSTWKWIVGRRVSLQKCLFSGRVFEILRKHKMATQVFPFGMVASVHVTWLPGFAMVWSLSKGDSFGFFVIPPEAETWWDVFFINRFFQFRTFIYIAKVSALDAFLGSPGMVRIRGGHQSSKSLFIRCFPWHISDVDRLKTQNLQILDRWNDWSPTFCQI